jgi:CBS domain-containing protein
MSLFKEGEAMATVTHTDPARALGVDVPTVAPKDTLAELAEKMLADRRHTALVLDWGRVIGVVTADDLVRALAERVHPSEGRVREWMTPVDEEGAPLPAGSQTLAEFCELAWELGRMELCDQDGCLFWRTGGCAFTGAAADIALDRWLAEVILEARAG